MRSSVFCQRCKKPTLHETDPRPVNHVLHFLLTFFFCGLWLPIWVLIALSQSMPGGRSRCTRCGSAPPITAGKVLGVAFGFVVMLALCGGGLIFVSGMMQTAREAQRVQREKDAAKPKAKEVAPPQVVPQDQKPIVPEPPAVDPERAKPVPDADNPGLPQPGDAPEPVEQPPVKPVVDQDKAATGMLNAGRSLTGDARARWLRKLIAKYPGTQAAIDSQAELDGEK